MSINPYVHFPLPPVVDDEEDVLLRKLADRFAAYLHGSKALTKAHIDAVLSSVQDQKHVFSSVQRASNTHACTVSFSKVVSHLPHGLILSVAEFLGDRDLCLGMALTCKYWHRVCNSDMCWRMLFLRDFVPGGLLLPSWHPSTIVQTVAEVLPPADMENGSEGEGDEARAKPQPYFKSFRIGLLKAKRNLLGFWRCGKLPVGGGGFVYWILVDQGERERRTLSLVIDPVHVAGRFLEPQERHLFKLGRDMPLCRFSHNDEEQQSSPSTEQEALIDIAYRQLENVPELLQTEGCGRMCDPNDPFCNDEFLIPSLTPTKDDPNLHESLETKFEMQGIFSWRFSNGPSLIFSARDPRDPINRLKGIKVTGNATVPAAAVAYRGNSKYPSDLTSYRVLLKAPADADDGTIVPLHGDAMHVRHDFGNDPAVPDRCDMCRIVRNAPVYASRFKCTLIDQVVRREPVSAKAGELCSTSPPIGNVEHAIDLLVDPATVRPSSDGRYLFLDTLADRPNLCGLAVLINDDDV